MQSKILFRYHPNGNLEQVVTNTNKIYQGQVGTVDYRIEMVDPADSNSWRATDVVLIVLTRPDNRTAQRVMIRRNGGWEVTSNGWETDVDITDSAYLNVSFIARRFSTLSPNRVVAEKTTAAVTLEIQPSAGYSPLNIAEGDAEDILEAISIMQGDIETLEAEKESKAHAEETYRTKADSYSKSESDNTFRTKADSYNKLETQSLVRAGGIIVDTYAQMIAIPAPANMLQCFVRNATGDPTVVSGGAYYIYDAANSVWKKTSSSVNLAINSGRVMTSWMQGDDIEDLITFIAELIYSYTGATDPGTIMFNNKNGVGQPLPLWVYRVLNGTFEEFAPESYSARKAIMDAIYLNPLTYFRAEAAATHTASGTPVATISFVAEKIGFLRMPVGPLNELGYEMLSIVGDTYEAIEGKWYASNGTFINNTDDHIIEFVYNHTVVEDKQDRHDNNLQTQSKEIVGAINELKQGADGAQGDPVNVYIRSNTNQPWTPNGSLTRPYTSISEAMQHIVYITGMDSLTYVINLIYDQVDGANLSGALPNIVFNGNGGSSISDITMGDIPVASQITFRNLTVWSNVSVDKKACNVLFDNVIFRSGIQINTGSGDSSPGEIVFRNCKFYGTAYQHLSILGSNPTVRVVKFEECDFINYRYQNNTWILLNQSPAEVIFTDCNGLSVVHNIGKLYFYGNNRFTEGDSLVSSAYSDTYSYLHIGSGASFFNGHDYYNNPLYGRINKTGSCYYTLGAVDRDAALDVLNGARLYDSTVNDIGGFSGLYAKAITGESIYGGTVADNLNTIAKNGFYTCYGTATGVPNSSYSWWVLHQNSNVGTASASQMAIAYTGSGNGILFFAVRTKTSSTWNEWERVANLHDVFGIVENAQLSSANMQPNKTYILFNATAGNNTLHLQTGTGMSFTIYKGDGTSVAGSPTGGSHTLNYTGAGMYLITIDGTFGGFGVNNTTGKEKYIEAYLGTNCPLSGYSGFYGCNNLRKVEFLTGWNYTTIELASFTGCSSLQLIKIPDSIASIATGTFKGCNKLSNVIIPANVTSIGTEAFRDCTNITEIYLPNSVTGIGTSAFQGCTRLKKIAFGHSSVLPSMGMYAFSGCRISDIEAQTSTLADNAATAITTADGALLNGYRKLY